MTRSPKKPICLFVLLDSNSCASTSILLLPWAKTNPYVAAMCAPLAAGKLAEMDYCRVHRSGGTWQVSACTRWRCQRTSNTITELHITPSVPELLMRRSTIWINGRKSKWGDCVIDQMVGSEVASAKFSCSAMYVTRSIYLMRRCPGRSSLSPI